MEVPQGGTGTPHIPVDQGVACDASQTPRVGDRCSGRVQRFVTLVTSRHHRRPLQRAALRRSDRPPAAFSDVWTPFDSRSGHRNFQRRPERAQVQLSAQAVISTMVPRFWSTTLARKSRSGRTPRYTSSTSDGALNAARAARGRRPHAAADHAAPAGGVVTGGGRTFARGLPRIPGSLRRRRERQAGARDASLPRLAVALATERPS